MKSLLIAICLVALGFSIGAAKKKDLAGTVENGVYTDDTYKVSLNVPDAWDYSIKKSKSPVRVILLKKQYDIPIQFQNAQSYVTVPRVVLYIDTTSLTVDQFVDSLLTEKYKSKQKNEILSAFQSLYGNIQLKKRAKITGDIPGIRIATQLKYTKEVPRGGSSADQADVVSDFYGGSIFFTKDGDNIIMLQLVCEWRYFTSLEQDFVGIVNGLKIIKSQ